MAKKVFVCWSGSVGQKLAEALENTILDDSEIEPWVSTHSVEAGRPWFEEITKAAKDCHAAVGILTPGAARRPWVNFEAGLLFGSLQNFKIMLFDEELHGPLANLQSMDGTNRDHLKTKLLAPLLTKSDRPERHLRNVYDRWIEKVTEAMQGGRAEHEIQRSADDLREAALALTSSKQLTENECLRILSRLWVDDFRKRLRELGDSFSASQLHYPSHLIDLQKNHGVRVQAIALLQREEQFWRKRLGTNIMETTHPESQRIFVVDSRDQLEEHWTTILNHAKAYKVYVLSYDELTRRFDERFVRDFAIIDLNGSKVVAMYDVLDNEPQIKYVATDSVIAAYEKAFSGICQRAVRVYTETDVPDLASFKAEVFPVVPTLTRLDQRPVEMSTYVPVEDYDKHEEEHAYYIEMMQAMLDAFRRIWPDDRGPYRVLEMGAGTGIFTKRLCALDSVDDVIALEIDWACHHKLQQNLRDSPKVKAYNEDSRLFNPSGRFHAVFSSFADHHIKPGDKVAYLKNVKRNLADGGVFIVGDEFLPPHDAKNPAQRKAALEAYHGHIIDLAREDKNEILVMLESKALQSGLDAVGDFKLSRADYETHLTESGFTFTSTRIGPPDDALAEKIGGVYVYVARPAP